MGDEPVRPVDRAAGLVHRDASWAGLRALVVGLGLRGFAMADALLERGVHVVAVDDVAPEPGTVRAERVDILQILGARVETGAPSALAAAGADVVLVSPGRGVEHPAVAWALDRGVPVWSEPELAWRLRPQVAAAPWLAVSGGGAGVVAAATLAMLRSAGERATTAGADGFPVLEAVLHPDPYAALVVELSPHDLRWAPSISPRASACVSLAGVDVEDVRDTGRVHDGAEVACVYDVADDATRALVEDAVVQEGCRAIGITLGIPSVTMIGHVEDVLADRAFVANRATSAAEIGTLADLGPAAGDPETVRAALAAAALARAHGVPPGAVLAGLNRWQVGG